MVIFTRESRKLRQGLILLVTCDLPLKLFCTHMGHWPVSAPNLSKVDCRFQMLILN